MDLPLKANWVIKRLNGAGFKAYAVGGVVRSALLGLPADDIDVATSAEPSEIKEVFCDCRIIDTGLSHGTVTVLVDKTPIEITTFRSDGSYSDGRRPDSVTFVKDVESDLKRRDFTVNALACNEGEGIIDLYGGREDIEARVIRAVGDPDLRFEEDALRILRAVRFASTLGFDIEKKTLDAMKRKKHLIANLSRERVASEIIKTLCGKDVCRALCNCREVIASAIPETEAMIGFDQKTPYHCFDVFTHSAKTTALVDAKPHLRLAAFLHDVGKPLCFSIDEGGIGHFYGHAEIGARTAEQICRSLKMSTDLTERVTLLVKYHTAKIPCDERAVKRWMGRLGSFETFEDVLKLQYADNLAKTDKASESVERTDELLCIANRIIEERQCFSLKDLAVNGNDIMEKCGVNGRRVGEILSELLWAVIDDRVDNDIESIEKYLSEKGY